MENEQEFQKRLYRCCTKAT